MFILPFGLYLKHGRDDIVDEALVTQFVALNTSIPVPTVLGLLTDVDESNPRSMLLMTRVPGRTMGEAGVSPRTMSAEQVTLFADTMANWFAQLRALEQPPGFAPSVCGFSGASFSSYRLDTDHRLGPFKTEDDFHAHSQCRLSLIDDPEARAMAARVRQKRHRICLTHGDITPLNVLVDDDNKPCALIDWGCAAWMPEYWELTSAIWRRQRFEPWVKLFSQALPGYEEELAVEAKMWPNICPW